jgi:hypothetical protein
MNNLNNPPAGYAGITIQTDVTALRAIDGTVYQNNTALPLCCVVSLTLPTTAQIRVISDAAAAPSLVISTLLNANVSNTQASITFWVLPKNYYKITTQGGSPTLSYWIEYK